MLVLYSACKNRRRLGCQVQKKQVYIKRKRRKRLEGLKAAQIEALLVQR